MITRSIQSSCRVCKSIMRSSQIRFVQSFTNATPKYRLMTIDKHKDITTLVEEYTAPSLAAALRDREETLAFCAKLAFHNNLDTLKEILEPYYLAYLNEESRQYLEIPDKITRPVLEKIRFKLNRLPRKIPPPALGRASVLIPLCNYQGKSALIYTKRSEQLKHFKGDICFPGGKIDIEDETVSIAALRECQEELGCSIDNVKILGVMRLDWADVTSITGIPVTPIIGFLGDYEKLNFKPNPDEVSEVFAIPLERLCDHSYWRYQEFTAPTFCDDKHKIWGLTGYLTECFISQIIKTIDSKTVSDPSRMDASLYSKVYARSTPETSNDINNSNVSEKQPIETNKNETILVKTDLNTIKKDVDTSETCINNENTKGENETHFSSSHNDESMNSNNELYQRTINYLNKKKRNTKNKNLYD